MISTWTCPLIDSHPARNSKNRKKEFARVFANSASMKLSRFSLHLPLFCVVCLWLGALNVCAQSPNTTHKSGTAPNAQATNASQKPTPPNTKPAKTVLAAPARWMWIWRGNAAKSQETAFFRAKFLLNKTPLSARLLISADDTYTVWFNERKAFAATGSDWTSVQEFDVTAQLKAGANLMAVEARNFEGPGGLLYKLTVTLPNNVTRTFVSDARVKAANRVPPSWKTLKFDDKYWANAAEISSANGGIWGSLRGAPVPDPARLVRLWDIRAGGSPDANPYTRTRSVGDRMLLSSTVSSRTDMEILRGAGFTLFQTDSDHLGTEQTAPNRWEWSAAGSAERLVSSLGLDWVYFAHGAFPPAWYRKDVPFTRLQCLEHGEPVEAFSLWEPKWGEFLDAEYAAFAKQFGAKTQAAIVGIHGDYGEAGVMNGGRVATSGQKEIWQERFGNLHDHLGHWTHDPLARADFRRVMQEKYQTLNALNETWKREYPSFDAVLYPEKPRAEARQEWLDYIVWYRNSVGNAVKLNLDIAKKHLPNALLMLPVGFPDEDIRGGNDNSLLPKLAGQAKAAVRANQSGLRPFGENAASLMGRIGSASRFYEAPLWLEPLPNLTANQETERLFEAVSQGAVGIFDWAGAAVANRDVYYRNAKYLRVEKPIVDVAMFYPARAQTLRPEQVYAPLFYNTCRLLRDAVNFDVVDDRMVDDGCLSRYRILGLWEGTQCTPETLEKIKAWVNDGGVLLAYDFGKVTTFAGDATWFAEMFGYANELAAARVTERFIGEIKPQYRVPADAPEMADFLTGDWLNTEKIGEMAWRWTGANAVMRLPIEAGNKYAVIVRVTVPKEGEGKRRILLANNIEIGELNSTGDVTYRFFVPEDATQSQRTLTLTFKSETFARETGTDKRPAGVLVHSVQILRTDTHEIPNPPMLTGAFRREIDTNRLNDSWTRKYGKGLTIFFPATRTLIKSYLEVIRRTVYNLSTIEAGRRDALPADNVFDNVYATLFTDKVLFYNATDKEITKTVNLPPELFAAWRGEVAIPMETSWKVTLEPHSIGAISFNPPAQELLFECEKFLELNNMPMVANARCSPGRGNSAVRLVKEGAITTRFAIELPGNYALYVRAIRNGKAEPIDILLDGQPVSLTNARAGETFLAATLPLTRGTHSITLRARPGKDVLADFILLTNDPTIAGYGFGVRTASVE